MNPLAFIPFIGSMIQGNQQMKTARYNTDRTIQANKELAEYAFNKDLEMWKMGNEYNLPANQRLRLEQAGFNPALMYNGGVSGNVATQLPKYSAPHAEYNYRPDTGFAEALSQFQDFRLRQAQTDNIEAQTKNVQTHTALTALGVEEKETEKPYWGSTLGGATDPDTGVPLWGTKKVAWLEKNQQLQKFQAEVRGKLIDNAMRQIELDFYKGSKIAGIGGSIGATLSDVARTIMMLKGKK